MPVHMSVHMSIHVPVHMSVHMSIHICAVMRKDACFDVRGLFFSLALVPS